MGDKLDVVKDSFPSFSVHEHHQAQNYSSYSISLDQVLAPDAGGGLADKDQSQRIDINWSLTCWSISSFHADADCMFGNQCGSTILLPSYHERSSFHILFRSVTTLKTSGPSLRSRTRSSYLVIFRAHARSRKIWTAGLAE